MLLRAVAPAGEIVECMCHNLVAAQLLRSRSSVEEINKILRLGDSLGPGLSRIAEEAIFKLIPATLLGRQIGLKRVDTQSTNY